MNATTLDQKNRENIGINVYIFVSFTFKLDLNTYFVGSDNQLWILIVFRNSRDKK